jgi:DNA-binding beta-propeller fold protein YncE
MVDLSTLAVVKKIDVGKGPDGIYFDAASQRVFTNNHRSHDITAIDAGTGEVAGTVKVEGNGEGAVIGKDGLIYVALEDKNEIVVFDPKLLEVKRRIPLDGVTEPTGLTIDSKAGRLFVGGHNKTMLVLDAETGKKIASFPTGSGTDAAGFDENGKLVFFSNGEGNITVIREKSPDEYEPLEPIVTQQSAKTMTIDKETGRILLPAATIVTTPSSDPAQKPKRTITDGTFCVLVVGP